MSNNNEVNKQRPEEIHLPGPSALPILLTLGITVLVVGLTASWFICGAGLLLSIVVIVKWIRSTREDIRHLPVEH